MSKKAITIGAAAIALLTIGLTWAFWGGPDPQIEKIKQLHAEAFKEGVKPEERRQHFQLIHQEMEKLTPQQRDAVFQEGRMEFERRMDERIDAYLALSPKEQEAFLDKEIQEQEKRRKEMEARWQANPNGGPPMGPPGGPPPGNRPPRSNNPGDRAKRHNEWLDNSTPEQRAKRSTFFADMQKRRYELGLPITPPRGPGRPR